MRLGLGTVQFGLDYGISNSAGQVSAEEVSRILTLAAESGMRVLDTAAAYGTSEEVLGQWLPSDHAFDLVTKTLPLGGEPVTPQSVTLVIETFHRSLVRLKQPRVYGLMVHHAQDLLAEGGEVLWESLQSLKEQGFVSKIGASVYSSGQIDRLLALPLDLIQLPLNVLDQRLVKSGQLAALKARGVEIHIRSAFLQGLLLMPLDQLPAQFASIRGHLQTYHAAMAAHGLSPAGSALACVRALAEVCEVIVGVTSRKQLEELIEASSQDASEVDFAPFAWMDENLLDPSRWFSLTQEMH